jgi:chaperonin cofactor prefoldin
MLTSIQKFMEVSDLLNTRISDLNNNIDKLEKRLNKIETIVYKAVGISIVLSSITSFILSNYLK